MLTLEQSFDWRSTFYLIAAFGGVSFVAFIFFPDSWRKERSQLYQAALKRSLRRSLARQAHDEKKRQRKLQNGLRSTDPTPSMTVPQTPSRSATRVATPGTHTPSETPDTIAVGKELAIPIDTEAQREAATALRRSGPFARLAFWRRHDALKEEDPDHIPVKLTIADVNPLPAMYQILKRPNNLLAVICSA